MVAKVAVALLLLRGFGYSPSRLTGPLMFINIATWAGFVVAVGTLLGRDWELIPAVASAGSLAVATETVLIRWATQRSFADRPPLGYAPALVVSLVGNAVSVAVSIGLTWPHGFR